VFNIAVTIWDCTVLVINEWVWDIGRCSSCTVCPHTPHQVDWNRTLAFALRGLTWHGRTVYDSWHVIASPYYHRLTNCVLSCWRWHWSQWAFLWKHIHEVCCAFSGKMLCYGTIFVRCSWAATRWQSMSIILPKFPNAKSDKILFTGSDIVTCGRTDRYTAKPIGVSG